MVSLSTLASPAGFGATIADWNSVHPKDPTVADAYNPGALTYAQGTPDRFIDVRTSDAGRVVAFTDTEGIGGQLGEGFVSCRGESGARGHLLSGCDTGTCERLVLHSKTLADVLEQAHLPNNMGVDSSGFVLIVSQGADPAGSGYICPLEIITMTFSLGGMFPFPEDTPPG
jgi:hypothetical protein